MIARYQLHETIVFSNTSPVVPLAMTFGGFFSRGLGMNVIGVPLLIKGVQQCCKHISQLVEETKEIAHNSNGQSIVTIDNKKFQA